jgi:DNA sulfur modification protein DndD
MQKEDELKISRDSITSQIDSISNQINSLFVRNFSHYFLFSAIKKMNSKVRELQEKGVMPPPINSLLISQILEKKHCIVCDRHIDDKIEKRLKALAKTVSSETGHHINFNNLNSSNYFNEETFKADANRLRELIDDKRNKDKTLNAVNKKLDSVSDNLRKIKQEDIRNIVAQKEELDKQLDSLSQKEIQTLSDIKAAQTDLAVLENNYNKLLSQISGSKIESKKLAITQKLKEQVEDISKRVLKRISDELNNNTHKTFKAIFKNFYKNREYKIGINEEFKIDVLDSEGNSLMGGRLAGGEIKVLALSFLIALSEFYGFDFPIIIDAPFTALGPDVASKVLESLKELSKKKQVILLTLPLEKEEEDLRGIMKELKNAATTVYLLGENEAGKGIYRADTVITKIKGNKK